MRCFFLFSFYVRWGRFLSRPSGDPTRRPGVLRVRHSESPISPISRDEGATPRAWRPPPPSRLFAFHYTVGGRNNNGQFRR